MTLASQEPASVSSKSFSSPVARDQPASCWGRVQKALRQFCGSILKAGPVPEHVAIIMDGNRRFATGRQLARQEGHTFGYRKLEEALEWCLDLGIACVSVYAFSIENFRRSPTEVDTLMGLAEQKLGELMQESSLIQKYGVRVRVLGELSLLPAAVQQAAHRITAATARHTTCTLNICFSYTSSQEMARAVQRTRLELQQRPDASDCEVEHLLESHLDTQGVPPVELLIRTSGEHRLSNFLLWQSAFAQLVFLDVLWPDFSFWSFLCALLDYQRHACHLKGLFQRTAVSRPASTPG
ncbi:hypothetical protein WJX74_003947 [Apatococcus lobatus]|uniref:Alkyl transferase n=1 Tax=Apatococcus lobatus TaxID=904363 RepID=A0AAW1QW47_9CHLO